MGASWGLLGYGTIGSELYRQVTLSEGVSERLGLERLPEFVFRTSGTWRPNDNLELMHDPEAPAYKDIGSLPNVVFNALPSCYGSNSDVIMRRTLEKGKTVITAEKSALAHNFHLYRDISDGFRRLGYNATVGGGTNLLTHLREAFIDPSNVNEVHLAVNGTLAAMFSLIGPMNGGGGISAGNAAQQAVKLGLAEPGATNAPDIMLGEIEGDVPKKLAIIANHLGLAGDSAVSPDSICYRVDRSIIAEAIREARSRRFLASLYPSERDISVERDNTLGGEVFRIGDGWQLLLGFQRPDHNPMIGTLASATGPANGFVISLGPEGSDGEYTWTGPGAGPRPTVNRMLDDTFTLVI